MRNPEECANTALPDETLAINFFGSVYVGHGAGIIVRSFRCMLAPKILDRLKDVT